MKKYKSLYLFQAIIVFTIAFQSVHAQSPKNLIKAVKQGKVEKVKSILDEGSINLNSTDEKDYTPLFYAVNRDKTDVANLLIDYGADVNYVCKPCDGIAFLHLAIQNNSLDMAKILIEKSADINLQNKKGETALHLAVMFDYKDMIILLCESGANLQIKDKEGLTPIERAVKFMQEDNVQLLNKYLEQ